MSKCVFVGCNGIAIAGDYACQIHKAWCALLADDRYRYAVSAPSIKEFLAGSLGQAVLL